MTRSTNQVEIDYPDSDGLPMGESDLHRAWMNRLVDVLGERYRGERVYVTGNLILYYIEGSPFHHISPDAFVVKDCDPRQRRIYKTWDEQRVPCTVFEVTSSSTRREDEFSKPNVYAEIGVREYFLYDPTADYLTPPLQGHRLVGGVYAPIEPDDDGRLVSEELGLLLELDDDGDLVFRDADTGAMQSTALEAAEAGREAAEARSEAAEEERDAALDEIARLKRLLGEEE